MESGPGRAFALSLAALVVLFLGEQRLAMAGDPLQGAQIYARQCAYCHGASGRSAMPGLPDFSWQGMGSNGLMGTDQHLLSRVASGGRGCPSFGGILSRQEILNVITHLRSLR
ncbi:MAG: cytochrome c [Magnetococcales bacterium]|nr:cytochrome c [Magnetococcales bacterium]